MPSSRVRAQPRLAVADVEASGRFYAQLLAARSAHAGSEYGRIEDGGELVLQLHDLRVDHHHGALGDAAAGPLGNGVLVWFSVGDFDDAVRRAGELGAEVVRDVHVNPNARQRELWLRDPDGYVVVLSEAGGS